MTLLKNAKGKKGFTLAEMLIVIAILVILFALFAPNVGNYVKSVKLKELDDSARSIYMAAQNKMSTLKSVGNDLLFDRRSVKMDSIPEFYIEEPADPDDPDAEAVNEYMRYIKSSDMDRVGLAEIKNDSAAAVSGHMSDLVGYGSVDDQLYFNNYVIEYNCNNGLVYGVFYCEDEEAFADYDPATMKRDYFERLDDGEEYLIGFYGGGKISVEVKEEEIRPAKIKTSNTEKLSVLVDWPEDTPYERLFFSLTVTGRDLTGKENTIAVVSKDDNCFIERDSWATVILDSVAPGCGADTTDEKDTGYGWNLRRAGGDGYIDLSYYVLERDFRGWVLYDIINEANPKSDGLNPYGKSDAWDKSRYKREYWNTSNNQTPHYYIDPGSDITVTVKFYDPTGTVIDGASFTKEFNSYFNKLDGTEAEITAGRHLQNLANYVNVNLLRSAVLTKTIDFSQDLSGQEASYEAWNSAETYKGTDRAKYIYNYMPVDNEFMKTSQGFSFEAKNGARIEYIRIDSTIVPEPGDMSPGLTYDKDYTAFFTYVNNQSAGSSASSVDSTPLVFFCPVVKGGGENTAVAAAYVENGSHLNNITVINPIVEGEKYVGGIVGKHEGTELINDSIKIESVEHYFDNYNYSYKNDNTDPSVNKSKDWGDPTEDPYARFCVRGTSEDSYAGGLIGYNVRADAKSLGSSVRVESLGYAGGIVGLSDCGQITGSYVSGHTYGGKYVGTTESGKDFVLVNIYGAKGAGGMVGALGDGVSLTFTNINYTTCSVGSDNLDSSDHFVGVGEYFTNDKGATYAVGHIIELDPGLNYYTDRKATGGDVYYPNIAKSQAKSLFNRRARSKNVGTAADGKLPKDSGGFVGAEPYDQYLANNYPHYPYKPQLGCGPTFVGDWPELEPIAGIFYWEYSGGKPYFTAIAYDFEEREYVKLPDDVRYNFDISNNEDPIKNYGYGFFYSDALKDADPGVIAGLGGERVVENNMLYTYDGQSYTFSEILSYAFGDALNVEIYAEVWENNYKSVALHGLQENKFSCSLKNMEGTSTEPYSAAFYFNPDYVGASEDDALGTDEKPYEIRTQWQFKAIDSDTAASFKQTRDLEIYNHSKPIGGTGYFSGTYDGGSHTIRHHGFSNLNSINGVGLFGTTRNATLRNIKLVYNTWDNSAPLSVSNANGTLGIGGLVGIAIGGSIENCSVDIEMTVAKSAEPEGDPSEPGEGEAVPTALEDDPEEDPGTGEPTPKAWEPAAAEPNLVGWGSNNNVSRYAVGGIAGFSSADISVCTFGSETSMIKITAGADRDGIITAVGGIAGSASGNISDCKAYMKTELSANGSDSSSFLFAGGIVGNNLDYLEGTGLTVSGCSSKSALTRTSRNVIIHPIAPDTLTIDFSQRPLYSEETLSDPLAVENFDVWLQNYLANLLSESGEEPINSTVTILSGMGVKDNLLQSTITACNYVEGEEYYNSQICGGAFGYPTYTHSYGTTLDDGYVSKKIRLPAKYEYIYKENLEAPTVGIYGVYERNDGQSVMNASRFAKGFMSGTVNEIDNPNDNTAPLYKYGVLVELGRTDEKLKITVGGVDVPTTLGTAYPSEGGGTFTDGGKIFEFIPLDLKPQSAPYSVTVSYSGVSLLSTSITVPLKDPRAGAYELKTSGDGAKTYIAGEYNGASGSTALPEGSAEDESAGEYGIFLEHSAFEPFDISDVTVYLNGSPTYVYSLGTSKYTDFNNTAVKVNGRFFNFYKLDENAILKLPEGKDFVVKVVNNLTGNTLIEHTFRKSVGMPHIGVFNGFIAKDAQLNSFSAKFAVKSPKADSPEYYKDGEIAAHDVFGVMLEYGYDVKNLKVTVTGDDNVTPAVYEYNTERGEFEISETKKKYAVPGRTNTYIDDFGGRRYVLYAIPEYQIPLRADRIIVEYTCADGTVIKLEVKIVDDLGGEIKEHNWNLADWYNDDPEKHWRECLEEGCEAHGEEGEHQFTEWKVTVKPTAEKDGAKTRTCTVCKRKEIETIKSHAHTYTDWRRDDATGTHYRYCTDPECYEQGGKIDVEQHELEYSFDQYNHTGKCTICGFIVVNGGHDFEEKTIKEPTDFEPGKREKVCKVCGYSTEEDIPPKLPLEKIPHLGVFREYKVTEPQYYNNKYAKGVLRKNTGAFLNALDDVNDFVMEPTNNIGIILPNNFDISKITVEINGGGYNGAIKPDYTYYYGGGGYVSLAGQFGWDISNNLSYYSLADFTGEVETIKLIYTADSGSTLEYEVNVKETFK